MSDSKVVILTDLSSPNLYRPPFGLPLYWRDETSGKLAEIVQKYLACATQEGEMESEEVKILVSYLKHYINAPCWNSIEVYREELAKRRAEVEKLKTIEGISTWIYRCLDINLDPL